MGLFNGAELDSLTLTSERLTLRPWTEGDAANVLAVMQDRTMFEFLPLPDPYTPEAARAFVTRTGHEGRADGTGLGCAVVRKQNGELVGSAALRLPTAFRREAEIGFWICPGARGNGYASELTRILAQWGFDHDLQRIQLLCSVRNLASARVALSAGFHYEGLRRQPAATADVRYPGVIFGRTRADDGAPIDPAFAQLPEQGLTDGVILLRAMCPQDWSRSLEQENNQDSIDVGFTGRPWRQEQLQERAARAGLDWLIGRAAPITVVDLASGVFAGSMHLRLVGPPHVGGIGYGVHPAFRGRGYTTRALRLLSRWAFDVAGFHRLELGAKATNLASQRSAAAAGFLADGVRAGRLMNPDGSYSDEVRFALVKS